MTAVLMPDLVDRPVCFTDNYRMRCGCGGVEELSAVDYAAEIDKARIPCSHCRGSIHLGLLATALRDLNDPALENEQLNRLAWYHTSTSSGTSGRSTPSWPKSSAAPFVHGDGTPTATSARTPPSTPNVPLR
ncbi:hypothetical protein [Virgisporangium aurantiacum]|uniref:hypothetical protein n=1 Tax=Virgisporangium aurantiacum TaxID=175570 RepID=UPI00194F33A6|nr:hypothetical protein [Virgisporangium aurantiacum]